MKIIYVLIVSLFLVACGNNSDIKTENDNEPKLENSVGKELPTSKEVYEYAQSDFNSLTNSGENYVPEKHDELVIQHTADHFGLDFETTDQLYMEEATGVKDSAIFKSTGENISKEPTKEMDMAMFKVLKPGMTYDEVKVFTNLEGTIDPVLTSASKGIKTYKFEGVGFSKPGLVFSYGELFSATQAGLVETPPLPLDGYKQVTNGMHVSDVMSLLGEGEYTGFQYSPTNGLLTSYSYKLNNNYITFQFFDDLLHGVPSLPTD